MKCFGRNIENPNGHCCFVNGSECPFLERGTERGQLLSCQLRRENGSWDAAIKDPRYSDRRENSPGRFFRQFDYKNCRDFQCSECGQIERGEISQDEFDRIKAL